MGILCIIAWNVTENINRLKLSSSLGRIRVDKETEEICRRRGENVCSMPRHLDGSRRKLRRKGEDKIIPLCG